MHAEEDPDEDTESEKEYPAFEQSETVNGVTVTVEAEEGTFPEDVRLSVSSISSSATEDAIEEDRDDDLLVAVAYTFDIKVLDEKEVNNLKDVNRIKTGQILKY